MLKPTIISIAMATVMAAAAISPALGLIAQHFSEADEIWIKLVFTAPSLTVIPFSFLSSYLTKKLPKKVIVLIGISIYIIAGVGAQFSPSIEVLLVLRFLLGAGVGLVMPLALTLISDHYDGKERAKMFGYNTAFSNVGGIVTILLAGYLASLSWNAAFNVYWLGLVIFVLVLFYLPTNEPIKVDKHKRREKVPFYVYGYALAACGVMLAYTAIGTNMALFLEQNNFGSSQTAGLVLAFSTVGGLMTSLYFVHLQFLFKDHLIAAGLLVMGLGFVIIIFSPIVWLILVGVCFVGFGQGILFPVINMKVLAEASPTISDKVVSIVSSMIYVGQFISPILLDGIGKIMSMGTVRFQYGVLATALIISVVSMYVYRFFFTRKNESVSSSA